MHTRRSGRTSPLIFNPEIERLARSNRATHRIPNSPTPTPPPSFSLPMENEHSSNAPHSETESSQNTLHANPPPPPPPPPPPIPPQYQPHNNNYNVYNNDGWSEGGDWGGWNGNGNGWNNGNGNYQNWNNYPPWNAGGYNGPHPNWNHYGFNDIGAQPQFRAPVQGVDSHFRPSIHQNPSPIVQPHHHGRQFEIRPQYLSILPTFRGVPSDEPYTHLEEFDAICSTIGSQGFTPEEVKLILFRFSLKDKAKQWFLSLPSASIHNWTQMQELFLDEYFPIGKTSDARSAIKSFAQMPTEAFHEAFLRFNEMLRLCPHHDIPRWDLVKIFYDGLLPEESKMVFSSSGGTFLTHHEDYEWNFLEQLSKGSKTRASAGRKVKSAHLKAIGNVESDSRFNNLEQKMDLICQSLGKDSSVLQAYEICGQCGDMGHGAMACQAQMGSVEEVNQVFGEKKPMDSNTYHPGLRNHPNFRYGNPANQLNPNFQAPNPQGNFNQQFQPRPNYQGNYPRGQFNQASNFGGNFQGQNQGGFNNNQASSSRGYNQNQNRNSTQVQVQDGTSGQIASLTSQVSDLVVAVKALTQKQEITDKAVMALTTQVGQIAESVAIRESGKLPSDTKLNPQHQASGSGSKGGAHVNVVHVLRSGKEYGSNPKEAHMS